MNWNDIKNAASGREDLVSTWVEGVNRMELIEKEWIKKLRTEGFKASHPNDGWVDRKNKSICLAYPHFNDGLQVGDKLMLGWPSFYDGFTQSIRPVKVIRINFGLYKPTIYFEDL